MKGSDPVIRYVDGRPIGDCDQANCLSRQVLDILGARWALLIVRQLLGGTRRYSELRHAIQGVSEKMLAQTLRELERLGLVSRTEYKVVPPHVEYALTEIGRECAQHVISLLKFVEYNVDDFHSAQSAYDERYSKG